MKEKFNRKNTIIGVIFYLIIIGLFGTFRIKLIFDIIEFPTDDLTNFSAYFSLLTGILISCLILIIIIYICYTLNDVLINRLTDIHFFMGVIFSIFFLILGEIAKFVYVQTYLKTSLIENKNNMNLLNMLINSDFKKICESTDYITYFCVSLTFLTVTISSKKIFGSILISFSFGILLFLAKFFLK